MSSGHVSEIVNPPLMTRSGHRSGRAQKPAASSKLGAGPNGGTRPNFERSA